MRILITGCKGQLARGFQQALPGAGHDVFAPPEDVFDITDAARVITAVGEFSPDIVINCAAYNNVDKAEEEYEMAYAVNALGPKYLAAACRDTAALLVHYSTDYVFDGRKEGFYTEDDPPSPINRYGESKMAGDGFIQESGARYLIMRTSWVYGDGSQNFLFKLMQWAGEQKVLKVVADQISVPTYTSDIISATMEACEKGLSGLYNLVNGGYATRYEVARYFLGKAGSKVIVLPVNTDVFPSPARRPYFSVLSGRKLSAALGHELPEWRDAIDRYVRSSGLMEASK
jgi:dTDP-4-dehydrorhamnose reductase